MVKEIIPYNFVTFVDYIHVILSVVQIKSIDYYKSCHFDWLMQVLFFSFSFYLPVYNIALDEIFLYIAYYYY